MLTGAGDFVFFAGFIHDPFSTRAPEPGSGRAFHFGVGGGAGDVDCRCEKASLAACRSTAGFPTRKAISSLGCLPRRPRRSTASRHRITKTRVCSRCEWRSFRSRRTGRRCGWPPKFSFVASRKEAGAWIMWAYATRRDQSLAVAEKILLEAESEHPQEATIQFNLGCYACQRGDLKEARRRVDRAIAIEKSFRTLAATDPDLAPLREADRAQRLPDS
jgi:hypothetical protein